MFDGNGYHLAHYFSPPAHFGQGHGQQVHGQQVQHGHGQQYQQQFYPPTAPPMLLSVSMGDPMGSMAVPMGSMGGSLGSIPGGSLPGGSIPGGGDDCAGGHRRRSNSHKGK